MFKNSHKMNKYKYYLLLALGIVLISFIFIKSDFFSKKDDFKTLVYKTETGFGYSISYNSKLLIKQDYIPAIQSEKSFFNFEDAQKAASLVIEKLNRKENPKLSLLELNELGIQLN